MAKVFDNFLNVLRGLGGGKDVTYNRQYKINAIKSFQIGELRNMYATNWIASKVIDIPVNDALRSGRTINSEDSEKIFALYDELKIDKKISDALKWSRAYGGAILVIVANDNDMSKPLSMGLNDLKNIAVFDVSEIFGDNFDMNPISRTYLNYEYYRVNGTSQKIHNSRVIKLDGYCNSNFIKQQMLGFGLSEFERLYHVIGDAQESNDWITNLLAQSNIDVYRMNGLNDAVAAGMDDVAKDRIQVAQSMKSMLNAIILDKEDDYQNIAKNFSGLNEIDMGKLSKVAGASDIPLTRLLGKSADGMNATGEGDMKNYYDKIQAYQFEIIFDVYRTIDKAIAAHLGIEPFTFTFNSLYQMSDLEKADIELKRAQSDTIHFNNGVITETDIMHRLANNEIYPTITAQTVEAMDNLNGELNAD
jgi:phage-related protein (TIGR01555 family)